MDTRHAAYQPGKARVGEPTPQTDPDKFSDDEIMAEVKYLMKLNRQYGSNPIRTMKYMDLMQYLKKRKAKVGVTTRTPGLTNYCSFCAGHDHGRCTGMGIGNPCACGARGHNPDTETAAAMRQHERPDQWKKPMVELANEWFRKDEDRQRTGTHHVADATMTSQIASLPSGGENALIFSAYGLTFRVVYYGDTAIGDNNMPVHGDESGDFDVTDLTGKGEDYANNWVGAPHKTFHVSPGTPNADGNFMQKTYQAEQIGRYIMSAFTDAKFKGMRGVVSESTRTANADHTEVEMTSMPNCDFCGAPAAYDGKTDMGPWAYMCEDDFQKHGTGLGLGSGQRLVPRQGSRRTAALDDIVGYVYKADEYCPDDITTAMGRGGNAGWNTGMDAEEALNWLAFQRGINRMDELSFDSDDFPKVIFADQAEGSQCGICGRPLVGSDEPGDGGGYLNRSWASRRIAVDQGAFDFAKNHWGGPSAERTSMGGFVSGDGMSYTVEQVDSDTAVVTCRNDNATMVIKREGDTWDYDPDAPVPTPAGWEPHWHPEISDKNSPKSAPYYHTSPDQCHGSMCTWGPGASTSKPTYGSRRTAAIPRYELRHDRMGRGNRFNDLMRAQKELNHTVPSGEWYVYDRHEKKRMPRTASNPFAEAACGKCHGDGFVTENGKDKKCPRCKGTGFASGRLPKGAPPEAHARAREIEQGRFRGSRHLAEAVTPTDAGRPRIDIINDVLEGGVYADDGKLHNIDGAVLDAFTASMLKQIYDSLAPENKEKFDKPPITKLVELGWKHVSSLHEAWGMSGDNPFAPDGNVTTKAPMTPPGTMVDDSAHRVMNQAPMSSRPRGGGSDGPITQGPTTEPNQVTQGFTSTRSA